MRNILSALILCLCSNMAFANVTGSWRGWVDWIFDGSPAHCDARMKFNQTAQMFERQSGFLDCNVVTMDMGAKAWTLKDGQMFEEDMAVGTYGPQEYRWTEEDGGTVKIETEIKVSGQHMDYVEVWKKKTDESEIYRIQGRLFLSQSQ
jgi:hypothetical protein